MHHTVVLLRWILRVADVREGERARVLGMFSLLGLIIATSYVLKPVRNALFLSQFGASKLPYVYMFVALVLGVVAAAFARWAPRARLPRLFAVAAGGFAVSLLVFWAAERANWPLTGFVFYVWVSLFTALMPSLFWLFANYVFYSNEGRRLFPVVMAGGLLGSILGGAIASLLVDSLGTTGLLPVGSIMLAGVALLVRQNAKRERERMSERRSDLDRQERRRALGEQESAPRLVLHSRYLTMIAATILLTSMTSTLVDYQFNTFVERSFDSTDDLTGFFGTFFAAINVVAFVLQLVVAGRLLNALGVGAGLAMLPLAVLLASAGFVAMPMLMTAAFLKTADDGLSNSVNRASTEVLYLPVSLAVKNRVKAWLDLLVERVGRGLGGLTILLFSWAFSMTVSEMSWIVIGLSIPWIALVIGLPREYARTFRSSLARRDIADFDSRLRDQESLAVFCQLLGSPDQDERELLYALELLSGVSDESVVESVKKLAGHPSPLVRRAALRHLRGLSPPPWLDDLEERVRDDDVGASAEAVTLWLRLNESAGQRELEHLVAKEDWNRVLAVLDRLAESRARVPTPWLSSLVERHGRSRVGIERAIAARAIGLLPESSASTAMLLELLADPSPEVARAAATSAGALRHDPAFDALVGQLGRRVLRVSARGALARFGADAIARLRRRLEDPAEDEAVRLAIPRVLSEIADPRSGDVLFGLLPARNPKLHYEAVKSLGKLNQKLRTSQRGPSRELPRKEVDRVIEAERAHLAELVSWLAAVLPGPSGADGVTETHRLLLRVVEERCEFTRERIFRLLGLVHPADDVFRAWDRVVNGRPVERAAALEYLSNVVSKKHARLLPWLEVERFREAALSLSRRSGPAGEVPPLRAALRAMLESRDYWLAACAVAFASELEQEAAMLRDALRTLASHDSPLLREVARRALDRASAIP